jgi:hypothetical protein
MNVFHSSRRIPEVYGSLIALALIIYFGLIDLLGWIQIIELRLFNVVIMVVGIYFAIRQFKRTHRDDLHYFKALSIGMGSCFIGVSTFVLVLFIYLVVNKDFMLYLKETEPMGPFLDPFIASFAVWVEGIFSGMFATFIVSNSVQTKAPTEF